MLLGTLLLAAAPSWALDINTATPTELQTLKGVGPRMAERIVAERAKAPFASFAELSQRVKGVGPARVKAWRAAGAAVGSARGAVQDTSAGRKASRGSAQEVEIIRGGSRRGD
ncbi:MAG: helix-hairpin-helix domain-containing protein [Lautropia sp.]|nr:helix-hairpin-helix domain-containing protein [Lautropia sp.]